MLPVTIQSQNHRPAYFRYITRPWLSNVIITDLYHDRDLYLVVSDPTDLFTEATRLIRIHSTTWRASDNIRAVCDTRNPKQTNYQFWKQVVLSFLNFDTTWHQSDPSESRKCARLHWIRRDGCDGRRLDDDRDRCGNGCGERYYEIAYSDGTTLAGRIGSFSGG